MKNLQFLYSNLIFKGMVLLIVFTLINSSQFGASLSWIIIPCLLILGGATRHITVKRDACIIYVFYFSCLLSTFWSSIVSPERNLITFFILCCVYVISVSFKYTRGQIHYLNTVYIVVSTIAALLILLNWLRQDYYIAWFNRASLKVLGTYKDPNYVMAYIVPAILIIFFRMINASLKKEKSLYFALLLFSFSTFLTTGSRGPAISFICAIVAFYMSNSDISLSFRIKSLLGSIVFLVLLLIVLYKFLPDQAISRYLSISSDSRYDLWKASLEVFFEHPIMGGGMGSASLFSSMVSGNYSHNVFIDILSNFGIIGFLLFAIFFYTNCLKTKGKSTPYQISLCVAFMLPLFFINGFNTATFYYPLIMLTIYSYYSRIELNELSTAL